MRPIYGHLGRVDRQSGEVVDNRTLCGKPGGRVTLPSLLVCGRCVTVLRDEWNASVLQIAEALAEIRTAREAIQAAQDAVDELALGPADAARRRLIDRLRDLIAEQTPDLPTWPPGQ